MAVSGTALWDKEVSGKIKTKLLKKKKKLWKTVKFCVQFVIFCCFFFNEVSNSDDIDK